MKRLHVIMLSAVSFLPAAGAFASDGIGPGTSSLSPQEACTADIKKFCADVDPGQGRIVRCLRDHEAELSALCKAARGAARRRIERKLEKTDPD